MAGNLLWVDGIPPAVIDFSPYWRPAGYATALMIVDAVLWYGEGVGLVAHADHLPELDQLLLRGLLFRLTLDGLLVQSGATGVRWDPSQIEWDIEHARAVGRSYRRPWLPVRMHGVARDQSLQDPLQESGEALLVGQC